MKRKSFYDWCIEHDHQDILDLWDTEKNGSLTPADIAPYSKDYHWWMCGKCCLPWETSSNNIIAGKRCPRCCNPPRLPTPGKNDLATAYPDIAAEWDYKKNFPMRPEDVLSKSNKKCHWICSKCGNEWPAVVCSRTGLGTGCNICGPKKGIASRRKGYVKNGNSIADKRPDMAALWHPTLNRDTTPAMISPRSSHYNRYWLCPDCGYGENGEWFTAPATLGNSLGCPKCNAHVGSSNKDTTLYYYVSKLIRSAKHTAHPRFLKGKELDVYIPEFGIAIEYDGVVYHSKRLKEDTEKTDLCREHGITLIHIREDSLPLVPDTVNISVKSDDFKSLDAAIQSCIDILAEKSGITQDFKVDSEKDLINILGTRRNARKERSLQTRYPEIAKTWHPTKNGRQTPDTISFGSNTPAYWLCQVCNYGDDEDWLMRVHTRVKEGCPRCANKRITPGINDLGTEHPEVVKDWDYEKNYPTTPDQVAPKSGTKYWWKCHVCGGPKKTEVYSRVEHGCPYCSNPPKSILAGFNDLATKRPQLMHYWDYEKNDVKPTEIFPWSHLSVWWKCDKCNQSFKRVLLNMPDSFSCSICGVKTTIVIPEINSFLAVNPELESKLHPDYVTVARQISPSAHTDLGWICPIGHIFYKKPYDYKKCPDCYFCTNKRVLAGFNDLTTKYPEIAAELHPKLNNGVTAEQILYGSGKAYWWKCKNCGNEWSTRVVNRTKQSKGCPHCKLGKPIHIEFREEH